MNPRDSLAILLTTALLAPGPTRSEVLTPSRHPFKAVDTAGLLATGIPPSNVVPSLPLDRPWSTRRSDMEEILLLQAAARDATSRAQDLTGTREDLEEERSEALRSLEHARAQAGETEAALRRIEEERVTLLQAVREKLLADPALALEWRTTRTESARSRGILSRTSNTHRREESGSRERLDVTVVERMRTAVWTQEEEHRALLGLMDSRTRDLEKATSEHAAVEEGIRSRIATLEGERALLEEDRSRIQRDLEEVRAPYLEYLRALAERTPGLLRKLGQVQSFRLDQDGRVSHLEFGIAPYPFLEVHLPELIRTTARAHLEAAGDPPRANTQLQQLRFLEAAVSLFHAVEPLGLDTETRVASHLEDARNERALWEAEDRRRRALLEGHGSERDAERGTSPFGQDPHRERRPGHGPTGRGF